MSNLELKGLRNLSVRETEKLVKRINSMPIYHPEVPNPFQNQIARWENALAQKLSSTVKVQLNNKGEGKIVISVRSPEEIDWLIKNIKQ